MDFSTAAAPFSTVQRAVTRRLAIAIAALFITGAVAAIGTLLSIATELDRQEMNDNRFYSARALENRITSSKSYITSYAYWTTAYEHLSGTVDKDWAYTQQNMGKTLFTSDGYEGIFVLNGDRTQYAVVRGQLLDADISGFLQITASALIEQVHSQGDLTKPVSTYSLFEGWPALITAAAIIPNDERPLSDPRALSVLVFVDQLTPTKLRKIGSGFGLDNLTLAPDQTLDDSQPRVPIDSTGYSLIADMEHPGRQLLWSLMPTLVATMLVLMLLTAYFFAMPCARRNTSTKVLPRCARRIWRWRPPTGHSKPVKNVFAQSPKQPRTGSGRATLTSTSPICLRVSAPLPVMRKRNGWAKTSDICCSAIPRHSICG